MIGKAKYGDVIYVERTIYNHYGIYSGRNRVIHYCSSDSRDSSKEIIRETPISVFLDGASDYHVCEFTVEPEYINPNDAAMDTIFHTLLPWPLKIIDTAMSDEQDYRHVEKIYSAKWTVARARKKLGMHGYDLVVNNCEHFAIWCKTGISDSQQVENLIHYFI